MDDTTDSRSHSPPLRPTKQTGNSQPPSPTTSPGSMTPPRSPITTELHHQTVPPPGAIDRPNMAEVYRSVMERIQLSGIRPLPAPWFDHRLLLHQQQVHDRMTFNTLADWHQRLMMAGIPRETTSPTSPKEGKCVVTSPTEASRRGRVRSFAIDDILRTGSDPPESRDGEWC